MASKMASLLPLAAIFAACALAAAKAAEAPDQPGAPRGAGPNSTLKSAFGPALCPRLKRVKQACSSDRCRVIADRMSGRSCTTFCGLAGLQCYRAAEVRGEGCATPSTGSCDLSWPGASDVLCECSAAVGSSPSYRFAGPEVADLGFKTQGPQESKWAKGWLRVASVTPGSWAQEAGLQEGSVILSINGFILTPFNVDRLLGTRPVLLNLD